MNLLKTQHWVQKAIICRDWSEILELETEAIISSTKRRTAIQGLEIYRSMYKNRIIDCLYADFPLLLKVIGEELIDNFCEDYICEYPSQTFSLEYLGQFVPAFVQNHGQKYSDFSFIFDLAVHELAIVRAKNGGLGRLIGDELRKEESIELWFDMKFIFAPHVSLLSPKYNVANIQNIELWDKFDGKELLNQEELSFIIFRENYNILNLPIESEFRSFFASIGNSETLGTIIDQFLESNTRKDIIIELIQKFRICLDKGIIVVR